MNLNKEDQKVRILVLFGGYGDSYLKSCELAAVLRETLDMQKYFVCFAGISPQGKCEFTPSSAEMLRRGKWNNLQFNRQCAAPLCRGQSELFLISADYYENINFDYVFPLIYGDAGADWHVAAAIELAGIAHIGSSAQSALTAQDDLLARLCTENSGIHSLKTHTIYKNDFLRDPETVTKRTIELFCGELPLRIKCRADGKTKAACAHNENQLASYLALAAVGHESMTVEQIIVGKTIKIAIMGGDNVFVSEPYEDICSTKYHELKFEQTELNDSCLSNSERGGEDCTNNTQLIKAQLSEQTAECLKKAAVDAFRSIGAKDMALVGFILTDDGQIFFDYLDTLPILSDDGAYNFIMDQSDIPLYKLMPFFADMQSCAK